MFFRFPIQNPLKLIFHTLFSFSQLCKTANTPPDKRPPFHFNPYLYPELRFQLEVYLKCPQRVKSPEPAIPIW